MALTVPAGFTAADLVFSDLFPGTTLNTANWNTYMTSSAAGGSPWNDNGHGGSGNGAQFNADYFNPSQISVNNGLTLTAVQKSIVGNANGSSMTFPVTSGCICSYGKVSVMGGIIQASIKQPNGDGAWPAFWMLPSSGGDSDETDIQEGGFKGPATPNQLMTSTLHTGSSPQIQYNTGIDLTAGFNTFGLLWVPGVSMTFFINGVQTGKITSGVPNVAMFLILNNSVANSAASSWHTSLDSSTPQTMLMQVAGVQIYQIPGSGDTIKAPPIVVPPPPITTVPVLTISNTGGAVTTGSLTVTGTIDVADAGQVVTVFNGTAAVDTAVPSSTGKWAATISLNSGSNVLTAKASNSAGTGVSNAVTYTYTPAPPPPVGQVPTVTITTAGGAVTTASQTVAGTIDIADVTSLVSIYLGTTLLASVAPTSTGSWSANITLPNQGTNVLTAKATNATGVGTSNAVTYTLSTTPPPANVETMIISVTISQTLNGVTSTWTSAPVTLTKN